MRAFRSPFTAVALSLSLVGLASAPVSGQSAPEARAEALGAQADATAAAQASEREAERARRNAALLNAEAEALSARIHQLGEQIVAREDWLAGADERLAALEAEIAAAEARLTEARSKVAVLAAALQRISREPAAAILAHPGRPRAAARSHAQLKALIRQFDTARQTAQAELKRIEAARADHAETKAVAAREAETLAVQIAEAERLLVEKQVAEKLETRRAAKEEQRAKELAAQAARMAERAAQSAAAPSPPLPAARAPAPAAYAPTPPTPRSIDPALLRGPFVKAKGRLLRPAAGRMRIDRAPDGHKSARQFTRPHARVIAPWKGVVLFAGDYSSHQVVIIEPENGYALLLAGFGEITVRQDQRVEAGQLIGRMPGSGGYQGRAAAGAAREELYIEVSGPRGALDPNAWFETETQR